MISLQSAESALKDAYLEAVTNQLNTNTNPLYSKIKQSTTDVYGKSIIKMAPVGLNGGIGAGSETGTLPTASGNTYAQFKTTLKNLYGRIQLSDKAIRASESSAGAFVDLLDAEMEGLLSASKFNLSRMLYGDGSGEVGKITGSASGYTVPLASVKNLIEGMIVDVYNADAKVVGGLKIVGIDRNAKKVTFNTIPTGVASGHKLYVQGSKDNEITGLGAIFGTGTTLYGLNRETNSWLTPYTSTKEQEINDNILQTAVDFLQENSNSNIDLISCGAGVKRAYIDYLNVYRRAVDVSTVEGGYKAINCNGIPMISDRFVEDDTLYMLDTSKFVLHQLCDWTWIEGENGGVLHQDAGQPTYSATLVKYADLICDQPNGQAKFTNLSTSVTNPFAVNTSSAE